MTRTVVLSVAAAFQLLTLACSRNQEGALPLQVHELASQAGPGSGEPNLTSAPDGRTFLSWIERVGEGEHALKYAVRRRSEPWSAPVTVSQGTGWFVNWADFPSMAALADGTLYAQWLAKSGSSKYAYDVQVVRSLDGGATWSEAVAPHRDGTQTEHGFVSMIPWSRSEMGLFWLDGRRTAGGGDANQAGPEPAMSLVHTTIDRDGGLGAETLLDDRVCDCCQTDAAVTDSGIVLVYRDRSPKEVRDMAVIRHAGGRWSEPKTLAADGWEINGCPVNGPAIAASGEQVAVAWFTAPAGTSLVKAAFSSDSGATFAAPVVVDNGHPLGRLDVVMLGDGSALVSWLEQVDPSAQLRVRRIRPSGKADPPVTIAESTGARSSGFPRMVRSGDEVLVAWRDAGEPPRVRTAVIAATPIR